MAKGVRFSRGAMVWGVIIVGVLILFAYYPSWLQDSTNKKVENGRRILAALKLNTHEGFQLGIPTGASSGPTSKC